MGSKFELTQDEILEALDKVVDEIGHHNFYVMGSASLTTVMGDDLPLNLRMTNDIDLMSGLRTHDPAANDAENFLHNQIDAAFGEESDFNKLNKFYISVVDRIFFVYGPEGWRERCLDVVLPSGKKVKSLEPHDCACFKLAAGRGKDAEWLVEVIALKAIDISLLLNRIKSCDPKMLKVKAEEIQKTWSLVKGQLNTRGIPCRDNILE